MWYRDPNHPELGRMFMPDSEVEAGGLPPGMIQVNPVEVTSADIAREHLSSFTWDGWVIAGATDDRAPAQFEFAPSETSAGNLSAALNGSTLSVPAAPTPEDLDARLAEGRCYTCGRPIDSDDPMEMFDREECQQLWRMRRVDLGKGADRPLTRTDYVGQDLPDPDPGDTYPRWLGTTRPDARRAAPPKPEHRPAACEDLPIYTYPISEEIPVTAIPPIRQSLFCRGATVHDVAPLPARWDYKIAEVRQADGRAGTVPTSYGIEPNRLRPDGTVVASFANLPESVARRINTGFAIGAPRTPDHPALRALEQPPPGAATGWPLTELADALERGYQLALPTEIGGTSTYLNHPWAAQAMPLLRRCQRCGQDETPVIHAARYPNRITQGGDGIYVQLDRAMHIVCGGCLLPYPGPILVPVWEDSPEAGVAEIGLVHAGGWGIVRTGMTEGVTTTLPPTVTAGVWQDLYDQAAPQWGCALPGCEGYAYQWLALAAAMHLWEWALYPQYGEPMVFPLCARHTHGLHRTIRADLSLAHRFSLQAAPAHTTFEVV